MKHLPKHLRQRWRYLAVSLETWPDAAIEQSDFQRYVWFTARNLLGDTGSADLDLTVVRFQHDGGDGGAIVRTRRDTVERARGVLACLDEIDGEPVGLRVAGVSGTIRACEEKYMGRGPEGQAQRYVAFDGAERSATVRDGRIDVRIDDASVGATSLDI